MKRKVTLPDRVEALCFAVLGAAIAYAVVGGSYTTLITPRSLPYLIIGAVLLFVLATAAWLGLFHATERSVLRFLIALIIPGAADHRAVPAQQRQRRLRRVRRRPRYRHSPQLAQA